MCNFTLGYNYRLYIIIHPRPLPSVPHDLNNANTIESPPIPLRPLPSPSPLSCIFSGCRYPYRPAAPPTMSYNTVKHTPRRRSRIRRPQAERLRTPPGTARPTCTPYPSPTSTPPPPPDLELQAPSTLPPLPQSELLSMLKRDDGMYQRLRWRRRRPPSGYWPFG